MVAGNAEPVEQLGPQLTEFRVRAVTRPAAGDADNATDGGSRQIRLRAEEDHAVRKDERLIDVMGHENDGCRLGGVDVDKEILHGEARERVEGAEGLVEQQHARATCKGSSERHALSHATRDLSGALVSRV